MIVYGAERAGCEVISCRYTHTYLLYPTSSTLNPYHPKPYTLISFYAAERAGGDFM